MVVSLCCDALFFVTWKHTKVCVCGAINLSTIWNISFIHPQLEVFLKSFVLIDDSSRLTINLLLEWINKIFASNNCIYIRILLQMFSNKILEKAISKIGIMVIAFSECLSRKEGVTHYFHYDYILLLAFPLLIFFLLGREGGGGRVTFKYVRNQLIVLWLDILDTYVWYFFFSAQNWRNTLRK